MIALLETYLVDDWRKCLQWSSVRLHLAMLGLSVLFEAMPVLDPNIAGVFPKALQSPIIGIYAVLALVLRLTKLKSDA